MSRLLLVLAFLCLGATLYSQQLPLFSQNREYWSYINPAMLNGDYFTYQYNWSFGANYRHQWGNQTFTPRTAYARGEYFSNQRGFSFIAGGYMMHDQVGPTGFTGVYGRIAGVIGRNPEDGAISVGFTVGAVQHYLKGSQVRLQDPNDILNGQDFTQMIPDIGVGIAFHHRLSGSATRGDVVYGGLSIPQLFNFDLTYRSDNGEFEVRRQRHYFANLGYYKTVRDQFFELAIWAKYVEGNPIHIDVSGRYQPIPYFWIEMGLSSALQIRPGFGVNIGDPAYSDRIVKIGYNFEWLTGSVPGGGQSFSASFGNSHEIAVVYLLGD